MASETLRQRLGLDDAEIDRLISQGMPVDDPLRAIGWLLEQGKLLPPRVIPLKALAEYFSVTPQSIRNWRDQGMPSAGSDLFDVDEVARWRLSHIRTSPAADRLAQARAAKAELGLREKLAEVAPTAPLLRRLERRINEAKAILNQLPDSIVAAAIEEGLSRDLATRLHQRAADILHRTLQAIADLGRPPNEDETSTPEG